MSDLLKRTISGLIGILLLFAIVIKGGHLLSTSVFILSLIGLKEFFDALNQIDIFPIRSIAYFSTLAIYLTNLIDFLNMDLVFSFSIILILLTMVLVKDMTIVNVSMTILSILYIPFCFNHINFLNRTKFIWLIFLIPFATDTFAYLTGNLIGKRKLCPEISPNKTIEGFIGGVLGSILATILYSSYMNIRPLFSIIILSIIGSILGQLGDLVASRFKRLTKIKDYGFIMPGHGGVLDRFDSIILSVPFIYYYAKHFLI